MIRARSTTGITGRLSGPASLATQRLSVLRANLEPRRDLRDEAAEPEDVAGL